MSLSNSFDDISTGYDPDAAAKQEQEAGAKHSRLDYLIHQTFEQSDSGRELLQLWTKDSLILTPSAIPGDTLLEIGIKQGMQDFIRKLIITVEKVNNE